MPSAAWAVTTTAFELEGVDKLEAGRFEGTALTSDGRVVEAPRPALVELEGASIAYCSAVDAQGRVFVGTGNGGAVFRVDETAAHLHATLDAAVVTSLAPAGDALYAGAMPSASVIRIDAEGQTKPFATFEGVEQVWALAYDARRQRLYAGTGPEGRLYAVSSSGKVQLLLDTEADHVLSVALGEGGAVYAGTSDGALLYRIDAGRTEVVHDFPGDELGALSVRAGRIAVAANAFPDLPKVPKNAGTKDSSKAPKLKPGKGEVWLLHGDGRADKLFASDESHITSVELDDDGHVFAALTGEGRVVRIDANAEHGVWAEVEGRQIMALGLTRKAPHLLASDSAALVRMRDDDEGGLWTSEALDAETRARWGELTPRFEGNVQWQTRSGNTEDPDATWSTWSRPARGAGPVRSPAARYLQIRARLKGEDAELRAIDAFYLASNRPARSRNIRVEGPKKKPDPDEFVDGVYRRPSELQLEWDTDNPDGDRLRYELSFAREGSDTFLPMLEPGATLHESEYSWQTRHLPDGLYRVRITSSDAPSNPAAYALSSSVESGLIRVDNHAPRLRLRHDGDTLHGEAEDDTSRIAALTMSVDGGPFLPIAVSDDLLDQQKERFEHALKGLEPGTHIVAVRATDAAGNARIEQLSVDVR